MNDDVLHWTLVRIRLECMRKDGTSSAKIDETLALASGGRLVGWTGMWVRQPVRTETPNHETQVDLEAGEILAGWPWEHICHRLGQVGKTFACYTFRAWSVPSVSKTHARQNETCGFVRPTPAGFLAGTLVSSVETISGVSVFVMLAQWPSENIYVQL